MSAMQGIFTAYVGRQFAVRLFGLLLFFVVLLQMLDLLNKSQDILAPEGAGWRSVADYIALRAPGIASQFAPFAALLAVVVTLSLLNLSGEITVMRAAGMSVHRVLFPIGFVCALVASAHFFFHEFVVVKSEERLAFWEANGFPPDLPPDSGTRTDVRLVHDGVLIHAGSAARAEGGAVLRTVTINPLSESGLIEGELRAQSALFQDGAWRLLNGSRIDAQTLAIERFDSAPWDSGLDPELLFALTVNPDKTPIGELWRKIGQLRADGADARAETTSLLSRFSKPLATLVMPLLGAIAGFGVTRRGNQLQRAVVGAAIGFSYFVIENLLLALGKLGVAPAMLGAFFPFALFLVLGFAILAMMEN